MRAIKNRASKGTMEAFAYLPYLATRPDGSEYVGTFAECVDSKTLHGILRKAEKETGLPEYGVFAFTVARENGVFAALTEKGRLASGCDSLSFVVAKAAGINLAGAEE